MPTNPLCKTCGKPIRKKTKCVYFVKEPRHSLDFSRHVVTDNPPKTIDECRRHTNQQIVAVKRGYGSNEGAIGHFYEWDGISYVDEHFCCGSCATRFAYFVLASGRSLPHTKAYAEAERASQSKRKEEEGESINAEA